MRLVTWNTQWRFGDWQVRQPMLAEVLVAEHPDVVLLQETWPGQAEALAESCGLQVIGFGGGYFDQQLSNVPVDEQFGNAVLARTGSLIDIKVFPSEGDPAPRCVVLAEVAVSDQTGTLLVASTHLSHLWDRPEVRSAQLETVAGHLAQLDRPFLLAGDCNLVPSSPEYQTAIGLGLVDNWVKHRPDDLGPTMVPINPEISYAGWMNDRNGDAAPRDSGVRLDYVWTVGEVATGSIDRIGFGTGLRWPSDHLGLVCELDLVVLAA
ncbi:MAG: endonuclease/exonuclease/phosphatase family metal-dependent hydrolase [Acidimicrobiales bacterium]|jgi:endonuclease/exonuclease/phosphatase family metal-dependent hydrolase